MLVGVQNRGKTQQQQYRIYSETHLKLKYREIPFLHKIVFNDCTEHATDTFVLRENIKAIW